MPKVPAIAYKASHDFQPGSRDIIDEEDLDEVENILEILSEQTEINNILGEVAARRVLMLEEEMQSSDSNSSDEEEVDIGSDDTSMSTDSDKDEDSIIETDDEIAEEVVGEPSNLTENVQERRVIDDYDPNDEDDEVVKKIILELKKPRSKPPNIDTTDYPTDLSFHPNQDILAVSTVTGDVLIYRYSNEENKLLYTHEIHSKAVRDVEFSVDGRGLISASRDKSIVISDLETGKFKKFWDNAHDDPIYTITVIDENLIASGDDEGTVKLWDVRTKEPVFSLKEVEDYISKIITNNQKRLLVCTSGDGLMTTFNIASKKMYVQSEPYEEELTCGGIFRNESKLVVGSSKGNFYTFNWGEFGYHNDAFSGPSTPISLMLPITERIAITAGEEGIIRAMHLFPGRILGIVGQHSLAVETMDISNDGELIATSSHDNDIRFWNIKYFEDFDGISYNSKPNKAATSNNLPSSLRKNRADFFADLAE
ncbi:putative Platelet-activating factor acetylhydrolase IB subunit beta [Polypedilum vanderplanki]|uniref:WD repeat-containing protein 55 homolog n=1 Tax=Polypedilum vanderplanki TaxID=319348 RepID=A0A9J6C2A4_POLVA|nr:putative Platelet-activating factor acetylhydrolase IB subunit beta [Polypedilum vanderplanki]